MTQPTFNNYPAAREEAKRLARYYGHKPGRFWPAGFSNSYGTECKKCRAWIGAQSRHGEPWAPYGSGTRDQCPITG